MDALYRDISKYLIYSPLNGNLVWTWDAPCKKMRGKVAGSITGKYLRLTWETHNLLAQRIIYWKMLGELPECVDHINNIQLDNIWGNLRAATKAQNAYNCKTYSNSTTGVKGVSFIKSSGKYVASITVNKVRFRLGRFDTLEEAQQAITDARTKHHGTFRNHG